MSRSTLLLGLSATALGLVAVGSLYSYSRGTLPGTVGPLGAIPNSIARSGPGCGQCHLPTTGPQATLDFMPAQRSLDLGQAIQVNVDAGGGAAGSFGGMVFEATRGAFSAGATTQVDAAGAFISHQLAANGRQWQFGYTAPMTPGEVLLYGAVNTANGAQGRLGDIWTFHGDSQTNSVPIRLYANAPGVTHLGDGCVGGFGLWPVMGGPQSPAIGNQAFQLAVHGTVPSSLAVFLIGTMTTQLNLAPFGINGCTLHVFPSVTLNVPTSPGGTAANGDGTAILPLPLPNDPALVGVVLHAQTLVVDPNSGRPAGATMTNAVSITFQ